MKEILCMITLCCHCETHTHYKGEFHKKWHLIDELLVRMIDDKRIEISHGVCPTCFPKWIAQLEKEAKEMGLPELPKIKESPLSNADDIA